MVKIAMLLATLAPLVGAASTARADERIAQTRPPVQVAPPVERPYGFPSTTQQQQQGPSPNPPYQGPYQAPYAAPPDARFACPSAAFTELRIAPLYGGTAWVYDGPALVGYIEPGMGTVFLPQGRAYGIVVTRGDRTVWQGHVLATPGTVALAWDRYGAPVVDRMPPPPSPCAPWTRPAPRPPRVRPY